MSWKDIQREERRKEKEKEEGPEKKKGRKKEGAGLLSSSSSSFPSHVSECMHCLVFSVSFWDAMHCTALRCGAIAPPRRCWTGGIKGLEQVETKGPQKHVYLVFISVFIHQIKTIRTNPSLHLSPSSRHLKQTYLTYPFYSDTHDTVRQAWRNGFAFLSFTFTMLRFSAL